MLNFKIELNVPIWKSIPRTFPKPFQAENFEITISNCEVEIIFFH